MRAGRGGCAVRQRWQVGAIWTDGKETVHRTRPVAGIAQGSRASGLRELRRRFRPAAIPALLAGKDVVGQSQTGIGQDRGFRASRDREGGCGAAERRKC